MTSQAQVALNAAAHYKQWGRVASVRYCQKRGVPRRLLTICLQLAAVKG